ncbi:hypothetical protein [Marinactinospora rubrisoli]|uniref:Integral membrane protein n=1 Tax=Marinactinospora rubrisoli TaxID=2715399 RepID=A0ABW2KQG6_9ACTN
MNAPDLTLFTIDALTLASGYPDWNSEPQAPPGLEGFATDWIGWARWVAGLAGFFGLIICGVMMMVGRRNRGAMAVDGATGMLWVIGGLCVVVMAGSIISGILTG